MNSVKFNTCQVEVLSTSELHEINGGSWYRTAFAIATDLYENGKTYWSAFKEGFKAGLR
jgi:hypothetical protein